MTEKLTERTLGKIAGGLGRIVAFERECQAGDYTDTGDAWELIYELRDCLREVMHEVNGRKFSVHIRLADEVYAADEGEAFDKMMAAFEHRDGFEIMGHDIIEETDI